MKKLSILLLMVFIFVMTSFAQTPKDVYEKYKDNKEVTCVVMGEELFKIAKEFDESDEVYKSVENLESMIVLESEEIKFLEEVDVTQYKELIQVSEGDEIVKIYGIFENEDMKELIIFTEGDGENSMVYIKGNIKMENFKK